LKTPVDLRAEFGRRWRVELDEAAAGRWKDPWLFTIPCRNGHLFPAGPAEIGAATNRSGAIVRRLCEIAGADVVADGCDGANVVFPLSAIRYVARVMKPRSRRKLTPAHAAALARGRLAKKPPSGDAIASEGSPVGGKPASDTPAADRPSAGLVFSSDSKR
jgi:hypothetical protein